jgi:hypothetical protein
MHGNGFPETAEDSPPGDPPVSRDRQCLAGVVIQPGQDLHMGTGGNRPGHEPIVGEVGLPAFVGLVGLEANVGRTRLLLRLRRNQAALARYRLMVALDTRTPWWCSRCHRMVSGPASRPAVTNVVRSSTIWLTTVAATALGDVFGRRDRSSYEISMARLSR